MPLSLPRGIGMSSQAKKTLIQARRSRSPKKLEREPEVHQRSTELIAALSPDDV